MRRRYRLLLALLVVVAVPYYWLLVDNHEPGVPYRRFDLAELHRLAASLPGPRPERIAVQEVAWRRLPGAMFVAGGGLKRNNIVAQSFILVGPGGNIAIDSGIAAADAEAMGFERHVPGAQRLVEAELRRAALIVFTHEHLDHIGGLLRMADFAALSKRALITPEQLAGNRWADALPWPPGARKAIRPFRYREMAAVAPGVVLIRTPGHTPGSQMVYVQLAGGREYLFTGDTATMERSWRMGRGRSRLLSDLIAPEDRAQALGWLGAIQDLKRQEPKLVVIAGHDFEHLRTAARASGIELGFARIRR